MRRLPLLLALAASTALLGACDPHYDNGYYDANGNYVSVPDTHVGADRNKAAWPGKPIGYYDDSNNYNNDPSYVPPARRVVRTTRVVTTDVDGTYVYELPGVYNLSGDYLGTAAQNGIPSRIAPSRGLCTVYFPDRMNYDQPNPQSCNGLMERAPSGSLIVFGG